MCPSQPEPGRLELGSTGQGVPVPADRADRVPGGGVGLGEGEPSVFRWGRYGAVLAEAGAGDRDAGAAEKNEDRDDAPPAPSGPGTSPTRRRPEADCSYLCPDVRSGNPARTGQSGQGAAAGKG